MKWDATMKDRKSSKKKRHKFLTNEKNSMDDHC